MDIFKSHFGKKLRHALAIAGMKQKDLAEKLDVKTSTISRWSTGKDFPREERLPDIARALGVDPAFFGPETTPPPSNQVEKTEAGEPTQEIIKEIQELKKAVDQLTPSSPIIREILSILSALDEPKLRRALELVKVVRDDARDQIHAPKKRKDIR